MITLEQLDELEGRIVRALELIGDLRSENSRLETENERLRTEHDELKLALDEKEKTVNSLKEQLDKTGAELAELKQKETVLEKRITEMLSRLSDVEGRPSVSQSSVAPAAASFTQATPQAAEPKKEEPVSDSQESPLAGTAATIESEPADSVAPAVASVSVMAASAADDDDLPLAAPTAVSQPVAEEHGFARQADYERDQPVEELNDDEDIIILDDDDDDVVFADDSEIELIEDSHSVQPQPVVPTVSATSDFAPPPASLEDDILLDDEDDIGIFDMDDDDDFLIVEEDSRD